MKKVVDNTKQLTYSLMNYGIKVLTQGTDNHLLLLDLRETGITGQELESRLENIGIISNKNAVPFDTEKKTVTSGLRLGAAAVTSRGLGFEEMVTIAHIISDCIKYNQEKFEEMKETYQFLIQEICKKYPLYQD